MLGDSKVIIDWLNQKTILHATEIEGWLRRSRSITTTFQDITFSHIFQEYNTEADLLSKRGLLEPKGVLTYFSMIDGRTGPMSQINLFWLAYCLFLFNQSWIVECDIILGMDLNYWFYFRTELERGLEYPDNDKNLSLTFCRIVNLFYLVDISFEKLLQM